MICVDPTYKSEHLPNGYWTNWSKKYKTRRRAEQALSYIKNQVSQKWGIKIESCLPPIAQQERCRFHIYER